MNSKTPKIPVNINQKGNEIPFEIPVEGSLGLLALGAVGIKAWRKKRDEAKKTIIKKTTDE